MSSEGKRLTLYLDKQVAELQAEVERLREAIKYELRTEAHTGWRRRLEAVLALHSDEDAI